ncbi:Transmembrane protein 56-B [Durusdinium trenchii]|uniref:Transmembrane protein 56-B n=1 Tax=Durusdinium trenchii TaxID=1381693 RepID=A0ABP0KW85_9DINO
MFGETQSPIIWSAATFQASFWLSLLVAPWCFSHYQQLDSAKGEKAYWAATFSGVLHAVLIVVLCVMALYDSPELMSSTNFFQGRRPDAKGLAVAGGVQCVVCFRADTGVRSWQAEEKSRENTGGDPLRKAARFCFCRLVGLSGLADCGF